MHTHTLIHMHAHSNIHSHAHALLHTCMHIHTHTCTQACPYCQTYTHTPTAPLSPPPPPYNASCLYFRVLAHTSCFSVECTHLGRMEGWDRHTVCFCSQLGLGTPQLKLWSDGKQIKRGCAGGWRVHRRTSASTCCLI